jgi:DNA-binding transcriptional LysR family regulator
MKISQMQHFQAVCKYNNITKASAELHLSQPSISSSIKELETEFGINLFHRINKRLKLTQEGSFFLERVNEILESIDTLSQQMKDLGQTKNHIKIGVPPMIGTFLFPAIFNDFRNIYPEIQIEIFEYGSLQTQQLLEDDVLDIALVVADDNIGDQLHVLNILSTQLLFCVRPDHRLAKCTSVDIKMLKDEPLILFKADSFQNATVKKRFADLGLQPKVLLYSSQLYTIKKFISSCNAGAFLFQEIAFMEKDIVGIPLSDPIEMNIALIWKKNKHIYSDVAKLIAFTKEYCFK